MRKKIFAVLLAAVTMFSSAMTMPGSMCVKGAVQRPSSPYTKAWDFVFSDADSYSDRLEIQRAYLAGLIPDELIGNVGRDITEAEFMRLVGRLTDYAELTTVPEHENDRLMWISAGTETPVTRLRSTQLFNYYLMQFCGKTFSMDELNMQNNVDPTLYGATIEELTQGDMGGVYNYVYNVDTTTGAQQLDRDPKTASLRLDDNLTVKEAIQMMWRYSNTEVDPSRYVELSEIKDNPLVLSDAELASAEKLPAPDYENLPAYQGAWYRPQIGNCCVLYEDDFSMYAEMGFNFLRYTMPRASFMSKDGKIDSKAIETLDRAVRYAAKYGIHLRLDITSGDDDNRQILTRMRDGVAADATLEGKPLDGINETAMTAGEYCNYLKSVWSALAEHYKNVPNSLLSFQLFGEPWVHNEYGNPGNIGYVATFVTDEVYKNYSYMLADAIWAQDDDRFIATDGYFCSGRPSIAIAEEGVARNLASGGKERRILQTFHMFSPDYCWQSGFYGEAPSVMKDADYIPSQLRGSGTSNTITIKAGSTGFSKGTKIKICDNQSNVDSIKLVSKNGNTEVETLVGNTDGVKDAQNGGNKYITFTLNAETTAQTLVLSSVAADNSWNTANELEYIWITYPETSDTLIPIFGYFKENGYQVYGQGNVEEYESANTAEDPAGGLSDTSELAWTKITRFTKKKTTYIVLGGDGGDSLGYYNEKKANDIEKIEYGIANSVVTISGEDTQKYSSTFSSSYRGQAVKTNLHVTNEDITKAFMARWKDFQDTYHMSPMQNEMGPNNGSTKDVIYNFSEKWLEAFTAAGWAWGGVAHPNANGGLYDDYIYKGNYEKYDFHRTDMTQLGIYQKYMKTFDISDIEDVPHTGTAQTPSVTVRFKPVGSVTPENTVLTEGVDYDITYMDNVDPGTATVVVTGKPGTAYEGVYAAKRFLISVFRPYDIPVNVTFDANGGTIAGNTASSKTVNYRSSYGTMPSAEREGYTFDGWYTSASGGDAVTTDTVLMTTEGLTLYAHWTKVSGTTENTTETTENGVDTENTNGTTETAVDTENTNGTNKNEGNTEKTENNENTEKTKDTGGGTGNPGSFSGGSGGSSGGGSGGGGSTDPGSSADKTEAKVIVSGNNVSGNSVSGNSVSGNTAAVVSGNTEDGGNTDKKDNTISDNAYKGDKTLTNVNIGKNIVAIGDRAFAGCDNLLKVTIGKNVESIGERAFEGDGKLKVLVIKSGKLTKSGVKNCLKGSRVTTIKLKGAAKKNYKKYKKIFTKANTGRKVKVKKCLSEKVNSTVKLNSTVKTKFT